MRRISKSGLILILLTSTALAETVWTDFSPTTVNVEATKEVVMVTAAEVKTDNEVNKEKYRVYFEDKKLVLMVLGGIEYWMMNCGELTSTGEYFMALGIKKHNIDVDEMSMDMSFQTGLFAATLYNSCDHFLNQVKSIGLGMMFIKKERTNIETLNNIQDSEV